MGAAVSINVQEVEKLAKRMNAFALTGSDKESLLENLGEVAVGQTHERFDTQRDPQGDPWRRLTEAYKKRKELKSSGGILVYSGQMRMYIESQIIDSETIVVGSPMEYAGYHQEAKNPKRKRMFLGFGTDDITELQDAVDEFMRRHVA